MTPSTSSLQCPGCRVPLLCGDGTPIVCTACQSTFPKLGGIPWLLPSPAATLAQWQNRLLQVLQALDRDEQEVSLALKDQHLSPLSRQRLSQRRSAKAAHRIELATLLAPLALAKAAPQGLAQAMQARLPATQSLTGYFVNLHRDWAWETDENQRSLELLTAVKPKQPLGSLLSLGAGGGRLTYDVHLAWKPTRTVATDINPLMLFAAQRLLRGETLPLFEFPLAPLTLDQHAVARTLAAPEPAAQIELMFADALQPPFPDATFDTVLTSWLVDILPSGFAPLARSVNRLLKPGGVWLNFGSLAFHHAALALNDSFEEAVAEVATCGFKLVQLERQRLPYMCSPASCHGRQEMVTAWSALKTGEVMAEPPRRGLPPWLLRGDLPVPKPPAFAAFAKVQGILGDVVGLVDGTKTMSAMAREFAAKHGMTQTDGEAALRGFFLRQVDDGLFL